MIFDILERIHLRILIWRAHFAIWKLDRLAHSIRKNLWDTDLLEKEVSK